MRELEPKQQIELNEYLQTFRKGKLKLQTKVEVHQRFILASGTKMKLIA